MTSKKVALITGAGSGIGRASAIAICQAGYFVVLAGRRVETLNKTALLCREVGDTLVVSADISNPTQVKDLFAKIREETGRLDLLFNNAGTSAPSLPLEDIPYDQWQKVIGVNLTGAFLCTREAFKLMKDQEPIGGRIINNGSVSAHAPRPMSAPYTASKHAITGLTRSTSLDGRRWNIACGQIDIGNAATEMTEKMATGMPQANGETAAEARMDVQHVADAVVYMATLPLSANVQFMTVMATTMPFIGRG